MNGTPRGLRAVAATLALGFVFTAGLLFTTQTASHAYASSPTPVKLLPSAAKAAFSATPWGRGITTALSLAQFAGVALPWVLNQPANSDQTATPVTFPGGWGAPTLINTREGSVVVGNTSGISGLTVVIKHPSTSWVGTSINNAVTGQLAYWYHSSAVPVADRTVTCIHGLVSGVRQILTYAGDAGACATFLNLPAGYVPPSPTSGGTPDPFRRGTPYSDCQPLGGGTVVKVFGNAFTYKESQATLPQIVPPPCPESAPHRVGFGATSQPLLPSGQPDTSQAPSPIIPPQTKTGSVPAAYPFCIVNDCTVKASPVANPGPRIAPDGTEQPEPEQDAAGNYCLYGPYNVPASECNDTEVPVPGPTTPTAPSPAPSPDPNAYPRPTPEPVPVEGQGCMGEGITLNPVTWVFTPVKCALKWAFGISPETQAKWSQASELAKTKPPVSLVAGLGTFAQPFASIGYAGCPDWKVKVGAYEKSIVCGQGYTERLHDWRDLTGAALLALAVMPFLWRVWHAGIPILNVQPHR